MILTFSSQTWESSRVVVALREDGKLSKLVKTIPAGEFAIDVSKLPDRSPITEWHKLQPDISVQIEVEVRDLNPCFILIISEALKRRL